MDSNYLTQVKSLFPLECETKGELEHFNFLLATMDEDETHQLTLDKK